jgi:hypothetical protein
MGIFRVVREEFYIVKGIPTKVYFFIQKQKSFLNIKWWVYVTYGNMGVKTLKNVPIHFEGGLNEAETFIYKVLNKRENINGHYRMVLKTYDNPKGE